jgi:hypothetical protein
MNRGHILLKGFVQFFHEPVRKPGSLFQTHAGCGQFTTRRPSPSCGVNGQDDVDDSFFENRRAVEKSPATGAALD